MRIIVRILVWLLKHGELSVEDGATLTTAIVDVLQGAPLRDIITQDEYGVILFQGKPLSDFEKAMQLRDAARSALSNSALKLIWEQTLYSSFRVGVCEGDSIVKLMFAKTAIWNGENERKLLRLLAQEGTANQE